VVAFIFREEVYKPDDPDLEGKAELIIAKQRNGPTGVVKLAFIKRSTRFENLAHESGPGESTNFGSSHFDLYLFRLWCISPRCTSAASMRRLARVKVFPSLAGFFVSLVYSFISALLSAL
jgi:hypothetical protein